ncbi:hypothetical protein SADUNF_Sadunf02G0091000 [Salix dunnii]|uniref:Uncharacterized protein n=1 Tax=Salix dunnii TaxID=1413687 RepID=A0A835N6Z9_9ROSI|nr:hypothetical protein SADUNF_Sadunf02G0091000 [Salix dunnii]
MTQFLQVLVEIVEVRDLTAEHNGGLSVIRNKKQPDLYFNGRRMSILSKAGKKDVAVFRCEATGKLIFKLMSYPSSVSHVASPAKMLGTASISLHDLMKTGSPLSIEKWFAMMPNSGIVGSKPVNLWIALSFTPPVQAPSLLHMVQTRPCISCFFPLSGRFQQDKTWTRVVDEDGNKIINLQMRKLEYEIKCEKHKNEQNFMTAIKFSAEYPHGKAVALFDLKSASLKSNMSFNTDGESAKQKDTNSKQYANKSSEEDKTTSQIQDVEDTAKATTQEPYKSGDNCDCGAVAQAELMGGKGTGVVKNVTGEENYSNGSKAIINGGARSHLLGLVYSNPVSHIILEDEVEGTHCGGCGSCHGGCGGCGSQSASSIFMGDVTNGPQCGGCGSCHGGSCGQDQQ